MGQARGEGYGCGHIFPNVSHILVIFQKAFIQT